MLRLARRMFGIAVLVFLAACTREARPALRDDVGRSVHVPADVRRVVTLAPNITQIVFQIGAGKKIVGTDDFSTSPAAAALLTKVGGVQPNVEMIRALSPELVLSSSSVSHPGLPRVLADLGISLYIVKTDRVDDIPRAMTSLGSILRTRQGIEAAQRFRTEMEAQRRVRKRRPRVLFMVWPDPLYVAAGDTFIDDLLKITGAQNALPSGMKGWPQISIEPLIASSPDLVLFPDRSLRPEQLEQIFAHDARWRTITAIREKRYVPVDEDLFTRPGPALPAAASALNAILDRWEEGG